MCFVVSICICKNGKTSSIHVVYRENSVSRGLDTNRSIFPRFTPPNVVITVTKPSRVVLLTNGVPKFWLNLVKRSEVEMFFLNFC